MSEKPSKVKQLYDRLVGLKYIEKYDYDSKEFMNWIIKQFDAFDPEVDTLEKDKYHSRDYILRRKDQLGLKITIEEDIWGKHCLSISLKDDGKNKQDFYYKDKRVLNAFWAAQHRSRGYLVQKYMKGSPEVKSVHEDL